MSNKTIHERVTDLERDDERLHTWLREEFKQSKLERKRILDNLNQMATKDDLEDYYQRIRKLIIKPV